MFWEIVGLGILLLLSAFFSATEISYVVANKIKIEIRARKNNFAAKIVHHFIKEPNDFYSTILIGNNIINISFASIFAYLATRLFNLEEFYILVISTLLLLLFGELIPKYLARETADKTILLFITPVRVLSIILYPVIKVISSLSSFLVRNKKNENIVHLFDRDDIHNLIDESSDAGVVDEVQSNILRNVIDFGNQRVYEAMKPRTDIVGIEIDSPIELVAKTFIQSGYSKLPVYEETLDNIKGVLIAYDLFKNPKSIKEIMRNIIFVPETKKSLEMLNEFLEKRVSIAVVVDEFGGTAGLVTVEDILEEVLGEIKDEYDFDEDVFFRKINNFTFVISGKAEVDFLNEKYELNIPEGDYETIAGFIIKRIFRIPIKGEFIDIDNFKFQILNADQTKIILVKLFVESEEDE
ncbi:MAG: hemolysin family protein [bacterium]